MIFTNLAPNASFKDSLTALSFFAFQWKWRSMYSGKSKKAVRAWFQDYLGTEYVHLTDSGRSALYLGLQALDIGAGDEVIVPAYTCIVVTNSIRATGALPVMVDIGTNLNFDASKVVAAISPKTKAVLAQHTFGLPVDLHTIQSICNENNLLLIEDCAHALGATYEGRPVGSFGDMSFFSFGSDKIVSSVRGGALVISNASYATTAAELAAALPPMPRKILAQHIMTLLLFPKLKLLYRFGGKVCLYMFRKMGITAQIFDPKEKEGNMPEWYPTKYPNILAAVVLGQLSNLLSVKKHRKEIASMYEQNLPKEILVETTERTSTDQTYLHYPILIERVEEYRAYMKARGIQVGTDWNGSPIAPRTARQHDVHYAEVPMAKRLSTSVVQLPIHQRMTKKKANTVITHTKAFLQSHV